MEVNKRIKISKDLFLDEYVTKDMYVKWGEKCIWWIRPELITVDQFIRDRFGYPIVMNNWFIGGSRTQSGLRYPAATIGTGDSLHKFGCASDKIFIGAPPEIYNEIRKDIEENFLTIYKPLGLTTIEAKTKGWLHTDCRNIPNQKKLNTVLP